MKIKVPGFPNIWLKDESNNPSGTYKDRRSLFIIKKALKQGVSKLCIITSGNAGFSLARLAKTKGIKVVCIVDNNLKKSIKDKLKIFSYKVIECSLSKKILLPKQTTALVREHKDEVIWDASNGYEEAYETIVKELRKRKFDFLICPVGSGEAFVGLYNGLKKYKLSVKLIGVGVKKFPSAADKLSTLWTPYQSRIEKILTEGHTLIRLSEKEVINTFIKNKKKMRCEPSSAVVWAAFDKIKFKPHDKIILVNSGRGVI